jgi:ectoine hydroxylase-related dioxygenase (phytanoyl-CoA dioxygenase family)
MDCCRIFATEYPNLLTDTQLGAYRKDGFLVVENVFDQATLDQLRKVVAEFIAQAAEVTDHTDVYDLEPTHTPEQPRVRRIKTPHKLHPLFMELVKNPKLTSILRSLLGPNVRLHGSKLNMKLPHCDLDYSKAVACTGKSGSCSFHHVRLVHGSAQNDSDKERQLLLFECAAADAWPLLRFSTLEELDSRMICGESTIEPRTEHVPIRMPLPPALAEGSIYENQTALRNRYFGTKRAVT